MPEFVDYYTVLGVTSAASAGDIRKAKQQLAKQYHPDRNKSPAAHQMMALVNRAADVLLDPAQRTIYDAQLAREQASPEHTPHSRGDPSGPAPEPADETPKPAAPAAFGRAIRSIVMSVTTAAAWAIALALGVAGLILASNAQALGMKILMFVSFVGVSLVLPPLITAAARRVLYRDIRHANEEPE